MKYLLSIDPGYRYCGVAIWQDGKFGSSWLVQGIPQLSRTFDQHLLVNRRFWTSYWNYTIQDDLECVVMERMPLMRASLQRVLTIKNVTIIETFCTLRGIPIEYASATHVKKITTGNAKASKAQMRRAILNLYPTASRDRKITEVSFDEADAIAIGHTYIKDRNGKTAEGTPTS
jgi:Holliday junction resolvasome RuvABC endonuclease subunit